MSKEIKELEEMLVPGHGKLVKEDGYYSAKIVDMELDPIDCTFHGDGCVEIKAEDYKYIILHIDNLHNLIELIEESYLLLNDD